MPKTRNFTRSFPLLFAAAMSLTLSAQAASIDAQLSADETMVGNPVRLQVVVEGSSNAVVPKQFSVDGLQIQFAGQQTQVQVMNFTMTTSAVYTYRVLPLQEGEFEIPPIEARVGGKTLETPALKLTVRPGTRAPGLPAAPPSAPGTISPAPQAADPQTAEEKLAFAEMIIPKKTAYVGEIVPVEIRFYFNQGYPFQLQERPTFSGEGFTVEDMTDPQRSEQVIGGTAYHVFAFQSAITPVKSGELEIPSVAMRAVARIPSQGPSGFEDLFSQFFGNSGMPGFSDARQITIETKAEKLTVKALPKDGRPESFKGAIGEFTITSDASPEKAGAGDPVTLSVAVTGRGNFSAMGEPALTHAEGWRLYPPTEKFESADMIGYGGTKTFDNMMIAQEEKTATPGVEFAYFDPSKEQYVTLTADPIAVQAAASTQPQPAAPSKPAADQQTARAPTDQPEAASPERPGIVTRQNPRPFVAPAHRTEFLLANGVAAAALLAFLATLLYRKSRTSESGRRAALVRKRAQLLSGLDRPELEEDAFFDRAREILALDAELSGTGTSEEFVNEIAGPDGEALRRLLDLADEARFSGGVMVGIDTTERTAIMKALREVKYGK